MAQRSVRSSSRFVAAAAAAGATGDIAAAADRLLARWAEPHRGYHDARHLAEVLGRVDELSSYAGNLTAVRLAAWFHDAVYDPTAADNEERSAALARDELRGLGVGGGAADEVARLVRLTATHDPGTGDRDGAVLCDADLAVLAADDERYAGYAAGVRREYAHVDDATFARGRAAVLRRLAARPQLFRTAYGLAHWEEPARANVAAELSRLDAAADPRPAGGGSAPGR
jgi:predicted metal-dependent HD superfamily phosphohydrolase